MINLPIPNVSDELVLEIHRQREHAIQIAEGENVAKCIASFKSALSAMLKLDELHETPPDLFIQDAAAPDFRRRTIYNTSIESNCGKLSDWLLKPFMCVQVGGALIAPKFDKDNRLSYFLIYNAIPSNYDVDNWHHWEDLKASGHYFVNVNYASATERLDLARALQIANVETTHLMHRLMPYYRHETATCAPSEMTRWLDKGYELQQCVSHNNALVCVMVRKTRDIHPSFEIPF